MTVTDVVKDPENHTMTAAGQIDDLLADRAG